MRVSDLTRPKPQTVAIDLGDGDSVSLVFDSNKVTPNWVVVAQKRDAEQDVLSLPKSLADVLISWDVTTDEGGVYPPTPENIAVFSYPVQSKLLIKILSAAVPSSEEGNASSGTPLSASSTSEPTQLTSLNGQDTSPLPVPSVSPSPT